MAETRVDVMGKLVIHISSVEPNQDQASLTLNSDEIHTIKSLSEYLNEVISLSSGEGNQKEISDENKSLKKRLTCDEISLVEDNPYEASSFLKLISKTTSSEIHIPWNGNFAKLSAKWIIPRYVDHFTNLIFNELKKYTTPKLKMLVVVGFSSVGFSEGDGLYVPSHNAQYKFGFPSYVYTHSVNKKLQIQVMTDEAGLFYKRLEAYRRDGHFYKKLRDYMYGPCSPDMPLEQCSGSWTSSSIGYETANLKITEVPDSNTPSSISLDDQIKFVCIIDVIFSHVCYQNIMKTRDYLLNFLLEHVELCEEYILENLLTKAESVTLIIALAKKKKIQSPVREQNSFNFTIQSMTNDFEIDDDSGADFSENEDLSSDDSVEILSDTS